MVLEIDEEDRFYYICANWSITKSRARKERLTYSETKEW